MGKLLLSILLMAHGIALAMAENSLDYCNVPDLGRVHISYFIAHLSEENEEKNVAIVKELLEKGANCDARHGHYSLIEMAIRHQSIKMAELLYQYGASKPENYESSKIAGIIEGWYGIQKDIVSDDTESDDSIVSLGLHLSGSSETLDTATNSSLSPKAQLYSDGSQGSIPLSGQDISFPEDDALTEFLLLGGKNDSYDAGSRDSSSFGTIENNKKQNLSKSDSELHFNDNQRSIPISPEQILLEEDAFTNFLILGKTKECYDRKSEDSSSFRMFGSSKKQNLNNRAIDKGALYSVIVLVSIALGKFLYKQYQKKYRQKEQNSEKSHEEISV